MANKPKWQRARIVNSDNLKNPMLGRIVWVEAKPPKVESCETWRHSSYSGTYPVYTTNVVSDNGVRCVLAADGAELLSGPYDFADDVPLIPWEEFIRG